MKATVRWILATLVCLPFLAPAGDWVTYEGRSGPGQGKQLVFLTGDEEYRSEEGLPMLARILAARHGFKCTVLFAIDPANGTITPTVLNHIPGIENLASADMVIMLLRFRELPDEQMRYFVEYLNSGKPILALRTATHAFSYEKNKQSRYAKFDWRSQEWPGGFGQQVLGDTWVAHHGEHGKESTRGILNETMKNHPILRGVKDIWGPTDVYRLAHLPKDAQVLVYGQVLSGMKPSDAPVSGAKNEPMMPVVWLREYRGETGKTTSVITTTMGASVDLPNEGLRRLLVNACYWALGMGDRIPEQNPVDYVGPYQPTYFGFGKFKPGVKPADLQFKPGE